MKNPIAALPIPLLANAPLGRGSDSAGSAWVLSAMAVAAQASPQAEDSLIVRRVWAGREPDFYASTPSPDGRYLTEVDWTTGDLALIDLVTGELRHVTDKGPWEDSYSYAQSAVFSPDGRRIAYTWFNDEVDGYEIWTIDPDGSEPRVLLRHEPDVAYLQIEDWSLDEANLLVQVRRTDGTTELALVSARDGSVQVLKTPFGQDYAGMAAFSPDGRYVAYDQPSREGALDSDIYALAVDGGRELQLLSGPSDDRLMGWTRDGGSILYYSDRELTQGIWRLPITEGLAVGAPELVRSDVWRLFPLGFSREAYFFGVTVEQPQVYTATVDIPAGRILSPPTPVQEVSESWSAAGDWSPDGRYLAYVTNPFFRSNRLVIRAVTGDDTREIPLNIRNIRLLRWAPDSKAVFVVARGDDPNPALFRVDLTTGQVEEVLAKHGEWDLVRSDFSPDGRTLYLLRGGFPGETRIIARDMRSGEEDEIAVVGWVGSLSVSPDGRTLAVIEIDRSTDQSRLLTIPAAGGEPRELHRTDDMWALEVVAGLPWTPDGRYVLAVGGEATRKVLVKIPKTGGEPEEIGELPFSIDWRHVRLHPDGTRIAFNAGDSKGEVWMIQNIPGMSGTKGGRSAR
jgi:Tol biopolymer transport system component